MSDEGGQLGCWRLEEVLGLLAFWPAWMEMSLAETTDWCFVLEEWSWEALKRELKLEQKLPGLEQSQDEEVLAA